MFVVYRAVDEKHGMNDYIERDKVLAAAESEEYLTSDGEEVYHEYVPLSAIKSIPAADVVPVVRCKDCKWYEIRELKKDGTDDRRYKPSLCMRTGQTRKSTHFCADGKPKNGET